MISQDGFYPVRKGSGVFWDSASAAMVGKMTWNMAPLPGSLCTVRVPPWALTIVRPVPMCASEVFVEKRGQRCGLKFPVEFPVRYP